MTCECKVCGAKYETCYTCEKGRTWRLHTDTLDHYFIFTVLMSYEVNHDAKEAYDALTDRGIDLEDTAGYLPTIQRLFAEILSARNVSVVEEEDEAED